MGTSSRGRDGFVRTPRWCNETPTVSVPETFLFSGRVRSGRSARSAPLPVVVLTDKLKRARPIDSGVVAVRVGNLLPQTFSCLPQQGLDLGAEGLDVIAAFRQRR